MIPHKPTVWNGVQYRSRCEARWAIFLTELRIGEVLYEAGTLEVDGQPYVPDFCIRASGRQPAFFEVKPAIPAASYSIWLSNVVVCDGQLPAFYLGCGTFYQGLQPEVFELTSHRTWTETWALRGNDYYHGAIEAAAGARFDLLGG